MRTPLITSRSLIQACLAALLLVAVLPLSGCMQRRTEVRTIPEVSKTPTATTVPVAGSGADELVRPSNFDPSMSPNGQQLAFVSDRNYNLDIYIFEPSTDRVFQVTSLGTNEREPAWSPDSKDFAISSNQGGNYDIWLISPAGTNLRRLTTDDADHSDPAWSPDGSRIAFVSTRGGTKDIWAMNRDGTGQSQLTSMPTQENSPAWSSDGTEIVFSASTPESSNLWAVKVDTGELRQITTGQAEAWDPYWSPNGIVFVSNRTGVFQVWSVQPSGLALTQVTGTDTNKLGPIVSPVGNIIYSGGGDILTNTAAGGEQKVVGIAAYRGDLNEDGRVDCADIAIVKASFGKRRNQIGFDSRADLNNDGIVDVRDLAAVSQLLPTGTNCP